MHRLAYILPLLLLASCKPAEQVSGSGRTKAEIFSIGHGGGGFETYRNPVPPNTLAAIRNGYFLEGAEGVELDVQMTSDGQLVLFHDNELSAATDCNGCIGQHTYAELTECSIDGRNGEIEGTYEIPLLSDALKLLADSKQLPWVFLNVKPDNVCTALGKEEYQSQFANELERLISDQGWQENCFIETLDLDFLAYCKLHHPDLRLIYDLDSYEAGRELVLALDYDGLGIVNEAINAEQVLELQASGKLVVIWGVKIWQGTQQAVKKFPDFIMTDDVRMLRNALGR